MTASAFNFMSRMLLNDALGAIKYVNEGDYIDHAEYIKLLVKR